MKKVSTILFLLPVLALSSCGGYKYGNKDIRDVIKKNSQITNDYFLYTEEYVLANDYIRSLFDEQCSHEDENLNDYKKRFYVTNDEQIMKNTVNVPFNIVGKEVNTSVSSLENKAGFNIELSFGIEYGLVSTIEDYYTKYPNAELTINFFKASINEDFIKLASIEVTKENYKEYTIKETKNTVTLNDDAKNEFYFVDYTDCYKGVENVSIEIDTSSWNSGIDQAKGLKEIGHSVLLISNITMRNGIDIVQSIYSNVRCYRLYLNDDNSAELKETSPCGFIPETHWLSRNDIYGCTALNKVKS